jgi:hypothetical protein
VFEIWTLGCTILNVILEFCVNGLEFKDQGLPYRVWDLGFELWVYGLGFQFLV